MTLQKQSPLRRPSARLLGVPRYLLAIFFAVLAAFPFVFMVLAAFKTPGEFLDNPFLLPREATLENFFGLLTPEFGRYFVNSVIISTVAVAATVVIGALAAYPLARMNLRVTGPITILFLIGLMVPIHVTLIPIYVLTLQIGLYDNIAALIGPFVAFSLPVTVYVLIGFFRQIPEGILSAAKVDGAGHWRLFWQIIVPLSTPAISTVVIINFIFVWNEFVFALILLASPENFPLPLGLQDFSRQYQVDVPGVMAALTAASLPLIILFLVAQERVVSGLAAGALQGES